MKDQKDPRVILQETIGYDAYRHKDQEPSAFSTAFLTFISECEKLDLKISGVTFEKTRRPAETIKFGLLFGIDLYIQETP